MKSLLQEAIKIDVDVEEFDEWLRSMRLLVSQIGLALDNYLVSRPPKEDE